jgi:ABC-type uncharacterized transport system YnjBCD substrate-binding protein
MKAIPELGVALPENGAQMQVVEDTEDLVRSVPAYVDDFQDWFEALPGRFPFLAQFGLADLTAGLPEQFQDP